MPARYKLFTFNLVFGRRAFAASPRQSSGLSAPIAHATDVISTISFVRIYIEII